MKNMKLIMENFKKNMQKESWYWGGSKEDAEAGVEKQRAKIGKQKEITAQAIKLAADTVRQEILNDYDNEFEKVQDIIDDEGTELDTGKLKVMLNRAFGDAHAQIGGSKGINASEKDMLEMFNILDVLKGSDEEELMPSDQQDNPGVAVGQGGNY
jgi:hypothetical protein